ncbi:unnamed protein product [Moneuplotes crassus]|uniref:Uncharacterized protein n=1 Tax=Euplotes crassus TaxID=5936 RepID=A0AAD1X0X6_EUPCR|nr:unnamed protein product [Moneuplotes crassus]
MPISSKTESELKHFESMEIIPVQTERIIHNLIQLLKIVSHPNDSQGGSSIELEYKIVQIGSQHKTTRIYFSVMDKDRRISSYDIEANQEKFHKPFNNYQNYQFLYLFMVRKMLQKIQASELEYSESKYCGHEFRFHLTCKYSKINDCKFSSRNGSNTVSFVVDNEKTAPVRYKKSDIDKFNPISKASNLQSCLSLKAFTKKYQSRNFKLNNADTKSLTVKNIEKAQNSYTPNKTSITPREMRMSQASTLDRYREVNDLCGKTTKSSFLTSSKKRLKTHKRFYSSVIDRKIVPEKPGKGIISSPSDLINLDPNSRICGCPRLLAVTEDFLDRNYIEGITGLYNIETEFKYIIEDAINTLVEFPRSHYCCTGYQYLFVFYNHHDPKYLYWIKQLKKEGKIDDSLKVVVFVTEKGANPLSEDEFDIKILVKPVFSKDIKEILSI